GPGRIDVARGTYAAHPAFANLVHPGPPGMGNLEIHAVSWSADGRHAAALLVWQGPRLPRRAAPSEVIVLDLSGRSPPVTIPAAEAASVRIVGDRVVVGAPTVRVWTFAGTEVASLPPELSGPQGITAHEGGLVLLVNPDIRLLDPATWTLRGRWAGYF